jgi:hypothetical protein
MQILTEIDNLSATERIEVLSHTIALMKQNLPIEFDESSDPDLGLEVKPEVIEQLLAIRESKSPTLTTDEVKQRMGSIEDEHLILKFAGIFEDEADFAAVVTKIEIDRSATIEE